jgi:hypothetical protein
MKLANVKYERHMVGINVVGVYVVERVGVLL